MDEVKGSTPSTADEMVQTLDGRIVNKKSIKNGEIYINAQGKKVRKVIKKVVRSTTESGGSVLSATKPETTISASPEAEEASREPVEDNKTNSNTNISEPVVEEPSASQIISPAEDADFRTRIGARHSFLARMESGQNISTPMVGGVKLSGAERSQIAQSSSASAPRSGKGKNKNKNQEEEIVTDKSVSELEQAVMDENFNESLGKNGQSAGARSSTVSGKASNPMGSVLNNPLSNADNDLARGLAGSYSLATPKKITTTPLAKPKKKKVKKPINLWIPALVIASLYVICCGVYFIKNYNFGDKSVQVGEYYLNVGTNSKTEYYDGERFNFFELMMTYNYGNDNVKNVDMSKINLTTRANSQPTMGYTLKDGYISARWDGAYQNATKREVNVEFKYGNEVGYIPVTIYRNRLQSLSSQGAIVADPATKQISVIIWGNYTNELVERKGITLQPRRLTADEYKLEIYSDSGSTLGSPKLVTSESENSLNIDKYQLTDSQFENFSKIVVASTVNKSISSDIYKQFSTIAYTDVEGVKVEPVGFKVVEWNTGVDLNSADGVKVSLNDSFKFKIQLDTDNGYYFDGLKVTYSIGNGKYYEVGENNTFEVVDQNGESEIFYSVPREEITDDIKICVVGVTNVYPVRFMYLNTDGKYVEYKKSDALNPVPVLVTYGEAKTAIIDDAKDYSGHTFAGWREASNYETNPQNVKYVSENVKSFASGESFGAVNGKYKVRYFYAQYDLNKYTVNLLGKGFTLNGTIRHSDRTEENVNINFDTTTSYTFLEGDSFIFTIGKNDSTLKVEKVAGRLDNGQWRVYEANKINGKYTITIDGTTNKITDLHISTKYKIVSGTDFIDSITLQNKDGETLLDAENVPANTITTNYESHADIYYCLITMKENIKINGEVDHPIFNGLTFVEVDETSGAYKYSIVEKDLKNFNLVASNVTTKISVTKANEGFTIVGLDADGLIKLANFNEDVKLKVVLNEDYIVPDGATGVVSVKMNGEELVVVNLVNGENTVTLIKDKLKEAFTQNYSISISVVGIQPKPTEPTPEPVEP